MFVTKASSGLVSGADTAKPMVEVYSSNYKSGFKSLGPISLPDGEVTMGHSFTIMDTNEDQVFLFLENHGEKSPFGNIYISDADGRHFTISLKNVIKGSAVDFERVNSLDGTFIANIYSPRDTNGFYGSNEKTQNMKAQRIGDEEQVFHEEDLMMADAMANSASRMTRGATNSKQASTQQSV
jgi:hypothetical protein